MAPENIAGRLEPKDFIGRFVVEHANRLPQWWKHRAEAQWLAATAEIARDLNCVQVMLQASGSLTSPAICLPHFLRLRASKNRDCPDKIGRNPSAPAF
jgi:uncharacterized SAM-dependent methyltransferase